MIKGSPALFFNKRGLFKNKAAAYFSVGRFRSSAVEFCVALDGRKRKVRTQFAHSSAVAAAGSHSRAVRGNLIRSREVWVLE
jgi:hypothetical protein